MVKAIKVSEEAYQKILQHSAELTQKTKKRINLSQALDDLLKIKTG